MIITNRQYDRMINIDNVTHIKVIGNKIQAFFRDGSGTLIEEYATSELCKLALMQIQISLDFNKPLHVMSKEEDLRRAINVNPQAHHITGKKTKGHGGS